MESLLHRGFYAVQCYRTMLSPLEHSLAHAGTAVVNGLQIDQPISIDKSTANDFRKNLSEAVKLAAQFRLGPRG